MYQKIDDEIIKFYENCKRNYEKSTGEDQYDIALETVSSLNKNGIRVCRHTMITQLMENIVKEQESPEIIGCLFRSLNLDLETVITSKYASHLLEKVLNSCKNIDVANDDLVQFQSDKFAEYMWLHYPDYLENNIGSHIVRLFFQFICGVYITTEGKVYSALDAVVSKPMQSDHKEKFASLVKRFLLSKSIDQILANELMSATLQNLLVVCRIHDEDLYSTVSHTLMSSMCNITDHVSKKSNKEFIIPASFVDQHKSYLIECLILSLPDGKMYSRFSKQYLVVSKELFISTSLSNPQCCGILKASISRTKNLDLLLNISLSMLEQLLKLKDFQCGNVFLNLLIEFIKKLSLFPSNELEKLRKYKNSVIEIIQYLADVDGEMSLSKLMQSGLKDHADEQENNEDNVRVREHEKICSVPVSVLMQTLLTTFNPIPKSITKMFLNLTDVELVDLCSNAKASRVIDCFISCKNVLDINKLNLFTKLSSNQMNELATDKFGSRVLDAVFDLNNRQLIDVVKLKLEPKRSILQYHKIGKFIEKKYFGYIKKTIESHNKTGNDMNKAHNKGGDMKRKSVADNKSQPLKKKQKVGNNKQN